MTILPVLFEDHTAVHFRPLSWSLPVGELRCGLLNPRERVALACGRQPGYLVRGYLEGLAREHGLLVGPEAVGRACADGEAEAVLFLSPRIGAAWDLLDGVLARAQDGEDTFTMADDQGPLACLLPAGAVPGWLGAWRAWQREAEDSDGWRDPMRAVPAFMPPETADQEAGAWRRIWDLVPGTAEAIVADLARLGSTLPPRLVWGAVTATGETPAWQHTVPLAAAGARGLADRVVAGDPADVWLGPDCELAPDTAIDASAGPVILGAGVRVLPHAFLEGPLFVGSGSLLKAGACIYGETSLGAVVKIAGEVGESTFLDFSNKQHEGFIGHAYLGSWCNLGALTTNSDLKNTYGSIRVDLGGGEEDTGLRFLGLLMAEHGKTAIGTLFNTGTTVGFSSNVFGAGFPGKRLANWTWGDGRGDVHQDVERALATAATVMARRGCQLTAGHEAIFRYLA